MILPSIDQEMLYQRIDFGHGTAVASNVALIGTPLSMWRCPSDADRESISVVPLAHPAFDLASGNYCGSEGILRAMSHTRMIDIRDGSSQTFLLGERIVQTGLDGSLPFTSAWCGQVAFQDGYEYRSVPHLMPRAQHPINNSDADPLCFGSRHTGGTNFVLGDGSTRFLNSSIDSRIFEALGTANGGEAVQLP
jgi:prepilin-type processing-associated H-X9-DG protein